MLTIAIMDALRVEEQLRKTDDDSDEIDVISVRKAMRKIRRQQRKQPDRWESDETMKFSSDMDWYLKKANYSKWTSSWAPRAYRKHCSNVVCRKSKEQIWCKYILELIITPPNLSEIWKARNSFRKAENRKKESFYKIMKAGLIYQGIQFDVLALNWIWFYLLNEIFSQMFFNKF